MRAATAPAKAATFRCSKCHALALVSEMQLDAEGADICADCYLKEPPAVDVDGVFAEVAASYESKPAAPATAKAEMLTQLGAALGCDLKATRRKATKKSVEKSPPADSSTKVDGFPERCWYRGPFELTGPRPPKVQLEYMTMMDREARALADRGRADIVRFAQMMARVRAAGRPS